MPLFEGFVAFEFGTRRDCCPLPFDPSRTHQGLAVWDLSVPARVAF